MNIRIEVAKFEPGPKFEKTMHEIKENHMKSIASAAMSLSATTSFDDNIKQLSMNNSIEAEKLNLDQNLKILLMRLEIII